MHAPPLRPFDVLDWVCDAFKKGGVALCDTFACGRTAARKALRRACAAVRSTAPRPLLPAAPCRACGRPAVAHLPCPYCGETVPPPRRLHRLERLLFALFPVLVVVAFAVRGPAPTAIRSALAFATGLVLGLSFSPWPTFFAGILSLVPPLVSSPLALVLPALAFALRLPVLPPVPPTRRAGPFLVHLALPALLAFLAFVTPANAPFALLPAALLVALGLRRTGPAFAACASLLALPVFSALSGAPVALCLGCFFPPFLRLFCYTSAYDPSASAGGLPPPVESCDRTR